MFLALKELLHTKKKFLLIVFLVILIAYLVYFLTSLAYGLASSYTNGIYKMNADHIILDENANDNVMMSMLNEDDYLQVDATQKQKFGLFPAVILNDDQANITSSKIEVYLFGIEDISFFLPNDNLKELKENHVIIDASVEKLGYKIGDHITMPGYETKWTIQGFTTKATYQTAPIVYVNLDNFRTHRFGEGINSTIYNAVIVKNEYQLTDKGLVVYSIADYVKTLPGYNAQVLTFSMMIIFLIVIAAFVLGIFIYVLTLQKTSMFGVMKAQGISNRYIGLSVLSQTVVVVVVGIIIGFILTQISGHFLKGVVPFAANYLFYSIISVAFVIFAVLGGLFSVSAVVKIDPLKAIG